MGGFANAVLAITPATASPTPRLYPNPATLSGAPAGATVGIFDALGRQVATAIGNAGGTAALPLGLVPDVYLSTSGRAHGALGSVIINTTLENPVDKSTGFSGGAH